MSLRIFRNRTFTAELKASKSIVSESFQDVPSLTKVENDISKGYYEEYCSIKKKLQ